MGNAESRTPATVEERGETPHDENGRRTDDTAARGVTLEKDDACRTVESVPAADTTASSPQQPQQPLNEDDSHTVACALALGDHVYQWCSVLRGVVPQAYQHHGIVMDDPYWDDVAEEWCITLADFTKARDDTHGNGTNGTNGGTHGTAAAGADQTVEPPPPPPMPEDDLLPPPREEHNGRVAAVFETAAVPPPPAVVREGLPEPAQHPPPHAQNDPPGAPVQDTVASAVPMDTTTNKASQSGVMRTFTARAKDWIKVEYQANWVKRHVYRGGTCTAATSDAPGLVRARVQFLLDQSIRPHPSWHGATTTEDEESSLPPNNNNNNSILPPYHTIRSNGECVAVWCKTGTWATLQAAHWLTVTTAGQLKSTAVLSSAVAGTQVTVPAAGAWGWLGYTTHVSLLSTQPWLLPALVGYGVVTAGAPAVWLLCAKQHWKEWTVRLNTAFWENAVNHPDVFVECITYWSAEHEGVATETAVAATGTMPSSPEATEHGTVTAKTNDVIRDVDPLKSESSAVPVEASGLDVEDVTIPVSVAGVTETPSGHVQDEALVNRPILELRKGTVAVSQQSQTAGEQSTEHSQSQMNEACVLLT